MSEISIYAQWEEYRVVMLAFWSVCYLIMGAFVLCLFNFEFIPQFKDRVQRASMRISILLLWPLWGVGFVGTLAFLSFLNMLFDLDMENRIKRVNRRYVEICNEFAEDESPV